MAAELFNIPNRIARVRQSDYLEYSTQNENIPTSLDVFLLLNLFALNNWLLSA
jgi:trk system potassium uptake protein TrkA